MFAQKNYLYILQIIALLFVSQADAQFDRAESSSDFPLPVCLQSFSAVGGPNSVNLGWKTASETDVAGFNLYRSLGQNGGYTRINPAMIPAMGSGSQGYDYQYLDGDLINGFHYYYKLATVEIGGRENIQNAAIMGIAGNSKGSSWAMPPDFSQLNYLHLRGNYPEPFNGSTSIAFSVYEAGNVQLEIYNLLGTKVQTLMDQYLQPGEYEKIFHNDRLPSGVYLYRLRGERSFDTVRKMVLLR